MKSWPARIIFVGLVSGFLLACGCGSALQKPVKHKLVTYVLRNCQTVETVNVLPAPEKKGHVELTCDCSQKSEKLDAKTGRVFVECE